VLFPAFSRIQDDPQQMASIWVRANRLVGAVTIPALVGLVAVAPDLVHVVLGDRWHAVIPVLQILAGVGLVQSLQRLNGDIMQARNRTGLLLRFSIGAFAAHLVAFIVGLRWGIVGLAACYAISSSVVEPLYAWFTARVLGVSLWTFVRAFSGIAQASLAMFAAVAVTRMMFIDAGVPAGARLAALTLLGIAVFVPCCAWREPELRAELRRLRPASGTGTAAVPQPAEP
jgi:PST family polysaccharide transporter